MYRPGGTPELVTGSVLLAIAAALLSFALYANQAGGEGGAGIGARLLALGAFFFGGVGGFMLLGIDSKQLSTRVALVGLALGLIPYFLLFGSPGHALNAAFLIAALASGLAIVLRRSSHQ